MVKSNICESRIDKFVNQKSADQTTISEYKTGESDDRVCESNVGESNVGESNVVESNIC